MDNYSNSNSDIFTGLNEAQTQAVKCTEGPVLVLAGAGSGKTRVLTHRIAHIVKNNNVPSHRILAITFTNKATNEMKERLDKLLGKDHNVWVSTIHSFCVSVLRAHISKLGIYQLNFSIYDDDDSRKVLRKVIKQTVPKDDNVPDTKFYKDAISKIKQRGLTAKDYIAQENNDKDDTYSIAKVYLKYEQELRASNALDFDDLLVYAHKVLKEHSEVAKYYQDRFLYIHVDEYQDTNVIQNMILDIIAKKWQNIFVVGDDDQSIYGFRGAEIKYILEFNERYNNVTTLKLEKNYRSTEPILAAANALIQNNEVRHKKNLIATRGNGVKVEHIINRTDHDEANQIVAIIVSLKRKFGYLNSDFAILTRETSLIKRLEMAVNEANLDYRILGGLKLFETKEIKDISAYLRVISNKYDSEAFERIINQPSRGIGKKTQERIVAYAREKGLSNIEATIDIVENSVSWQHKKIGEIKTFVDAIKPLLEIRDKKPSYIIEQLVKNVPLALQYEKDDGPEVCRERLDNIDFYIRLAKHAESKNKKLTLTEFLQNTTLSSDEQPSYDEGGKLIISTVHAVKGLEFNTVFIVGCEENNFPSFLSTGSPEELEEERRVMYVAITRAKNRLYLSSATTRFKYGTLQYNGISRFIAEANLIKKDSFETFGSQGREEIYESGGSAFGQDKYDSLSTAAETQKQIVLEIKRRINNSSEPEVFNEDTRGYVKGAKVKHRRYGEGVILFVSGRGDELSATIDFPKFGQRLFTVKNAPLQLL